MGSGALPTIVTPALLASLRSHAKLPLHSWYFVTSVVLSMLNRPDQIPIVFQYAIENGPTPTDSNPGRGEKLQIARKLREALIKSSAIGGLPKTINALLALKEATPHCLLDEPTKCSPTSRATELYDLPASDIMRRGQTFFNQLYGKVSKRVMGQMDRSGTEDLGVTARLMYGYILSNTNVLSAAESSFVLIAGLIPQDVNPQLKGHLKGALNNGATVEEVKAVREVVLQICEASGMTAVGDTAGGWGWRGNVANL